MKMEESWNKLLDQLRSISQEDKKNGRLDALAEALPELVREFVFYDDELEQGHHLVHYTSWENALAIFQKSTSPIMRMYNYETANDPQEGKLWRKSWEGIEEASKWLNEYLPDHEKALISVGRSTGSTYGCSFSSDVGGVEDDLTYWRLYGNDGEGCSFKVTGKIGKVYKVRYLNEDGSNDNRKDEEIDEDNASKVKELLDLGKNIVEGAPSYYRDNFGSRIAAGLRQLLGGYHHLAKSSYYKDEREWRMIEVAPQDECVRYEVRDNNIVERYVEGLSLKDVLVTASSITIGPRVPNGGAARAYLESLVKGQGMLTTQVKISKQTYRSGV